MDPRALQHAATIEDLQRGLADVAVDALLEADPTVEARYGDIARRTWRTEGEARMAHLAQSVACGRPGIYAGHVAWAVAALRARHVPEADIRAHLASIERFDGVAWTVLGALDEPRVGLAGFLLDDGRAVFFGGDNATAIPRAVCALLKYGDV